MLHRLFASLVAVLALGICEASSLTITDDPGGRIGTYIDKYQGLRFTGEKVTIDGRCASACTLVLGFVSRDQLCATPRARLGFHQAFDVGQASSKTGKSIRIANVDASSLLLQSYPVPIQQWIQHRHGLPSPNKILWLEGKELAQLLPQCHSKTPPQDFNWRGLY